MGEDARFRSVAALAQAMAAVHASPRADVPDSPLRAAAHAAATGAMSALGGSFAAVSVWERERGRLRVLANVGRLAADETEFPGDESYPLPDYPEIAGVPYDDAAYGKAAYGREAFVKGGQVPYGEGESGGAAGPARERGPRAWVETREGQPAWSLPATGSPDPADAGADTDMATDTATDEGAHRGTYAGGEPGADAAATDPGMRPRAAALRRRGRGCCVVAPILLHGRAWGELYVARGLDDPEFDRGDAEFATVLAAVAAAGMAQHEQLEEARRLALTDPLTGLANRRAVDTRLAEGLARHRESGAVLSLVVCDINGLKRVNDEYGHEEGDRLLERFGRLLSLCGASLGAGATGAAPPHAAQPGANQPGAVPTGVSPAGAAATDLSDAAASGGALAARLGGDEFCLVSVGPGADEVVRVAVEVCRRAEELGAGEGVACGVASTGDPVGPVRSARRLFRLADAAQYQAKAAGARRPVVAGRAGTPGAGGDPVVRLADAPARPGPERRRIRGRPACAQRDNGGGRSDRDGRSVRARRPTGDRANGHNSHNSNNGHTSTGNATSTTNSGHSTNSQNARAEGDSRRRHGARAPYDGRVTRRRPGDTHDTDDAGPTDHGDGPPGSPPT